MDRKIKVAQVITRMDWGGSPDVLRVLCQKLDPDIYELRIFVGSTSHPTPKTSSFFAAFKDKITFIPELKREISLWNDWLVLVKLSRMFKKEKFDIVHTHTAKAGALGRLAARLAGVPIIVHTPHGHNFYGYFNQFASWLVILIEKFLATFTDRIMALTELEKADYLKFKVASGKKPVLIYMGLELGGFLPGDPAKIKESLDIRNQEKVVGYVGRLEPIKGPQFFVEAARICLENNHLSRFILVGEGSLRQELEEKVASWGLKGKIVFVGWRDDIADIMSILDILVLPSLNEAVGIVLLEAQSLGVPVVASEVGGIPEMIKDKETGILVGPGEPAGLALAINNLLSDPERLRSMSVAGKNWVKDRFKAEDMVRKISA
ncbi:MAG: glycosyltransferase family 4 protein, partial [Candidatus Omnitrophica bacterium]|nr:glycosyltransferase family 4 protein [Candidatus Omnitrophota bacterium]